MKKILIITSIAGVSIIAYFGYQYYYIQTLRLSEIVGKTGNSITNIAVNFFDIDTGLTRDDIRRLKNKKNYWLKRVKEIESIQNIDRKARENTRLLEEMSEDPSTKKIFKEYQEKTADFLFKILN